MFRAGVALSAFVFALPAFAQQPGRVIPVPGSAQPMGGQPGGIPVAGGAPQAAPIDPKLVAHLQAWEARMKAVGNVVCEAEMVRTDVMLKRQLEKQVARIYCMKPNYAFMRLDRAPDVVPQDPTDYQTWISDGKSIHQYSGRKKEYSEFKMNANGNIQGNLLLEFISGSMTAAAALQRFEIGLLKEDASYVYLVIKPRMLSDREDFETMTLVFYGPSLPPTHEHMRYLPALVKMTKNQNKEDEVWTFKPPQVNVKGLSAKTFEKQPIEKGWKIAPTVSAMGSSGAGNPRVVRP